MNFTKCIVIQWILLMMSFIGNILFVKKYIETYQKREQRKPIIYVKKDTIIYRVIRSYKKKYFKCMWLIFSALKYVINYLICPYNPLHASKKKLVFLRPFLK